MNDFISAIRTDREREINQKQEAKILISDTVTYRYVNRIKTEINGNEVELGVQANNQDVYFFVVDEEGNSYYSIYELYEIMLEICQQGDKDLLVDTMLEMIHSKAGVQGDFYYKGVKYHMRPVIVPSKSGTVGLKDGGCELTYEKLFVLLNFIQEKSSALFVRGSAGKKNEKYKDGLLRLFIALLISNRDHDELLRRGWTYDISDHRFLLRDDKKADYKYYLTDSDLSTIIELES